MHYDILDKERLAILPLLKTFKRDFYLAGGTALALRLGHRDSIDFDFFCRQDFSTKELFARVKKAFTGFEIEKIQEEKNTLSVLIGHQGKIKLSWFAYDYPLIGKVANEPYLKIASLEDVACMKLQAITGRSVSKDYVDLYYLLQLLPLKKLLVLAEKKYKSNQSNLYLKSLVYFDDIQSEPIKYKIKKVEFEQIQKSLIGEVKKLEDM
ncbi:MAG: nucleotidyl transferase AbiEii/AbiGii toxin family protein [Candidatus Falkowbacteria bacterium]